MRTSVSAPVTRVGLTDSGGGLYAYNDITFETISGLNITACSAGCTMNTSHYLGIDVHAVASYHYHHARRLTHVH